MGAGVLPTALAMARRGWRVFPVNGKRPRTRNGLNDATTDESQIRKWWELWPDAGVAIATGQESGLWALDVDGVEGMDELTALELDHGEIPETIGCKTRRGLHLYFRMNGETIRNSAGKVAPGLDVRGDGGYVVAPPSPHPDGGFYAWHPSPKDADLCDAPSWLLERVTAPEPRVSTALDTSAERFPEGTRNASLTSLAGRLRRPGMSPDAIYAALQVENEARCVPPLPDDEVRQIADSVGRYAPAVPGDRDLLRGGGGVPQEDPLPGESRVSTETTDPPPDLTLTDTGNATRLVGLHGHRLHFIPPWGKWLVCGEEQAFWTQDHRDVQVRELAKGVGRILRSEALARLAKAESKEEGAPFQKQLNFALSSLEAHSIRDMVELARGIEGIPLDHEKLDADPWLLGVDNGVIDLHTGKLRSVQPDDLITLRCPIEWNEGATSPRWDQALEEWFPDPEVRAYVKRVAGSILVGMQRDHVFVIHYGIGGNGKGTFVRALQNVLGPYAVEIHLSLLVETRYREHDTVRADLFRTRLAVAVETDRRVRLAEASVKNLTGADRIRARRMREDPWSFDPSHSLWLQTNHLPEIGGRDEGIWRRIRVVKWVASFPGQSADLTLDETLAAEAPGILRWLVEGCLEWQEHGLEEPEAVIRDTLMYRQKEDVLSRFADDVGLVFADRLEIQAGELQELLTEWARAEGIEPPSQDVGDWLRGNGVRQTRNYYTDPTGKRRRARFWVGVGIEDGNHESEQTEIAA